MYPDNRFSYQLTIYIFRYGEGTVMAIMHPDNAVAKKSVTRYMDAMRSVSSQVADSGHWGASRSGEQMDAMRNLGARVRTRCDG